MSRSSPLVILLVGVVAAGASTRARADEPRRVFSLSPAVDGAIIGIAALGNVVPLALQDRIVRERCPCDPSEVPGFDRFAIGLHSDAASRASDWTRNLALIVPPIAGLVALGPTRAFFEDATVFAEALAVSGALVNLAKYTVQRPIPRAYAGDPDQLREPGAYLAFYSSHATMTFTALTDLAWTMRLRYGEQGWPWAVAGILGTSVAAERVLAGHHFLSDVVVGAAIGIAVGTAVPLLHEASADRSAVSVRGAMRGVSIAGTF
ncbi:MAG TPA: phosphatase PAP2 family protein [Anaeromyxobacteraceae bacterium]|nr:phosphatase PAP2 family protein [Anaeromyxobacteraceae bacterium]